jgi:hypothetical protein
MTFKLATDVVTGCEGDKPFRIDRHEFDAVQVAHAIFQSDAVRPSEYVAN